MRQERCVPGRKVRQERCVPGIHEIPLVLTQLSNLEKGSLCVDSVDSLDSVDSVSEHTVDGVVDSVGTYCMKQLVRLTTAPSNII